MIKAISSIKQQIYYNAKPLNSKNDQNLSTDGKFLFINANEALALKNQIFFKGNFRENRLQKAINDNNLPLEVQTLNFVLTQPNEDNKEKYLKYSKTGSKFIDLYSRYLLHKKFPIKDEGELTNVIPQLLRNKNKSRLLVELIPNEILPKTNDKNTTQELQAESLNALLGAMIYENQNGFKTTFEFMNKNIGEKIFPKNIKINRSAIEELEQEIKRQGKSWQDIYQETRYFNEQWHYRIHYKNIILSQAHGGKHNHELRELCAKEALEKIKSGEINLNNAQNSNLIYTNYKNPTPYRIKRLEEFSQKWGLKFNDISTLHKVFLYGEMQDCSALAHSDTYEILEFIGDAVLGFCTHEILQDNLPNAKREEICSKRHSFVKNKNLAIIAKEMGLENYVMNRNQKRAQKRLADMFEALIGAIFLDGGNDGINNVYQFLDNNFRDEILNI